MRATLKLRAWPRSNSTESVVWSPARLQEVSNLPGTLARLGPVILSPRPVLLTAPAAPSAEALSEFLHVFASSELAFPLWLVAQFSRVRDEDEPCDR